MYGQCGADENCERDAHIMSLVGGGDVKVETQPKVWAVYEKMVAKRDKHPFEAVSDYFKVNDLLSFGIVRLGAK